MMMMMMMMMDMGCVFVCLFFRKVPGTQDIHHWSVPTIPSTSLELRLANSAGLSVQRTWAARSGAARSDATTRRVFVEVKNGGFLVWIFSDVDTLTPQKKHNNKKPGATL